MRRDATMHTTRRSSAVPYLAPSEFFCATLRSHGQVNPRQVGQIGCIRPSFATYARSASVKKTKKF